MAKKKKTKATINMNRQISYATQLQVREFFKQTFYHLWRDSQMLAWFRKTSIGHTINDTASRKTF